MRGFLHDTVEDTGGTLELVTEGFGPEASPALKASPADTAGGQEPSRSEKQAANLRKLANFGMWKQYGCAGSYTAILPKDG
ncbi:hypothetical protein EMIHUDRAFT_242670 [Emiliania huxleyi CCMP1516]|uniref:Uncharacterized protein n=2 Tax=Emiliania huxleyi TaxID=2903 RepID=A0A0D3J8B2_EMIH1|nr:hypothetical protein EMIHUDRAFT_242670 [Emiliania huxleyi CCMP1516]EOD19747.1 hypothetical protein EMIHUDRAFT_242670 [Emiliania huxleyi CCMP1516]|eukprot:XP_005772176.1 hypothetical protein EMIHUDRAFT_242670 [Emiliania huxleyi CCMP1516]